MGLAHAWACDPNIRTNSDQTDERTDGRTRTSRFQRLFVEKRFVFFDLRVALVGNFNQFYLKTYFKLVESVFYGHGPYL
jgi:hypothetical protein